jgi:hypothetical protein
VDRGRGEATLDEVVGDLGSSALRAAEDDREAATVGLEHPGEHLDLNVELLSRDQIHALKSLRHQGLEVAFNVGSRAGAQELSDPLLDILED